ncbi:MAG: AAA family ATPase [Candidatus Eremiobacteraeota bacterium]|nr:AAA family ATPase [Candidatus Eremiobacteraeota bacterium]
MTELFEKAILEIVSEKTGIPVERIRVRSGEGNLSALEKALQEKIVGQEEAKRTVLDHLSARRVKSDLYKPMGSFLFIGPSGCGKTEMAKVMAEAHFGDKKRMVRIDCSELSESHTKSKLIGAPPGYIGFQEGGVLTENVRKNPYSLVLFDEIEKAHPDIYTILLQIMDEGSLTDQSGLKADFRHSIVILTSNLGNRKEEESVGFRKDRGISGDEKKKFFQAARQYFPPEFLGRLSNIVTFHSLNAGDIEKLFDIEIRSLEEDMGISIEVSDIAKRVLARTAFSQEEGARKVKKIVRKFVNSGVSRMNVKEGERISLDIDEEGDLLFDLITPEKDQILS